MTPALADHLAFQAAARPGAPAVIGPAGTVGHARLAADVDALATELLERGLTRDDRVGLHLGLSYLHLLVILALDRLSIPSVSLAVASGAEPLPPDLARLGLTALVGTAPTPAAAPVARWLTFPDEHRPRLGRADAGRLAALDAPPDALLRIIWSSGTTGGPKGAALTRAQQADRLALRRMMHDIGPATRYFAGMPFFNGQGYARAIAALAAGGCVVLPGLLPDFLSLAEATGVTNTVATPAWIAELVTAARGRSGALRSLERLEVVGAGMPRPLAEAALDTLTPNVLIGYGTTETQLVACAPVAASFEDPAVVGWVLPWLEVQVVDPAGRPLPAGREGALRIRGRAIVDGYADDPEATRRNFRDGWFHPGDLGSLRADGLLRVTGRIEDRIPRGDALVAPDTMEAALRRVAGVTDAAVFPLADADGTVRIGAALVLAAGADPSLIRRAVIATLGPEAPERLLVVERLPRGATGKLLRRELVARARATGTG